MRRMLTCAIMFYEFKFRKFSLGMYWFMTVAPCLEEELQQIQARFLRFSSWRFRS